MIFERLADTRYFCSRIAHAVRRGEIEVHAFSLVTTHFHLLTRSPAGSLARAMQRIQGEYSRYFNRRARRDGTLYRARYFSKVIDSTEYFDNVVRYIDGNAVEAGLVAKPEWHASSSAYWYVRDRAPPWLSLDVVSERAARRTGARHFSAACYREAFEPNLTPSFREWMERRLRSGEGRPDPLRDLIHAAPENVLEWMRRKALLADGGSVGAPLVPWETLLHELARAETELRAVDAVRDSRCVSSMEIARAGLLRDVASLTLNQIARICGVGPTAIHSRCARHRETMVRDPAYAIAIAGVVHRAIRTVR